jgi:hypothetical protein
VTKWSSDVSLHEGLAVRFEETEREGVRISISSNGANVEATMWGQSFERVCLAYLIHMGRIRQTEDHHWLEALRRNI